MYLFETMKLFVNKDSYKDFISLLIGLLFIFTFSLIMMPDWPFVFFIGVMLFSSSLYRFVMVNEDFYNSDVRKLNKSNVTDYVLSKNIFVIIFSLILFGIVLLLSTLFNANYISFEFITKLMSYILLIVGSDNIIYIFHNKPVKSYASGLKRNEEEDIKTGLRNFQDQLPSLVTIIVFAIVLFIIEFQPVLSLSVLYYIVCIISLIYYMKTKMNN